jgi:signal transduction histidine kinase
MLFELGFLILTNVITIIVVMVAFFASSVLIKLRVSLVATVLSLVAWQDFVYISNHVQQDVLFWNNFVFLWPTVAAFSFFVFTFQLNAHKKWRGGRNFVLLEWVPAILLGIGFIVQMVSLGSGQIFISGETPNSLLRGDGYIAYIIGLVTSLLAVLGYLLLSVINTRRVASENKAIRIVFYTVLVAVVYGLISNVAVPLISGGQSYAGLGILTVDIFAVGFALSIIRGRLLDVKLYAVRTVVYILSLATLAGVYGLAAFVISQFILGYADSPLQIVINISLALLLAFIFQPIRRFFDRVTNRIFYRDEYSSEAFFAELNQILATTTDLRKLLERTAQFIGDALKAEHATFFIYHKNAHHVSVGTAQHVKLPTADARQLDIYIAEHGNGVIITDFVKDNSFIKRLLASHKISVLLPLSHKEIVVGYFMLGVHRRNEYSRRDIRMLDTIDDELIIAIQNAVSLQEVRDLNASLEQRISEATRELRASNAQLQRLDEAKDEFISMASHQLRTPLTSIKGYISMLMEGDVGKVSTDQKHLLQEAFVSSERMVRLIGDFLNVSRLQTGKFVIEKQPVDLAKLVGREIESLGPNASARSLTFEYKQPRNFPMLSLDESKIQQVIMNFADNALYYSKEKTTIKVSLAVVKDRVEFKVKDTGIGVPLSEQDNLFSKFYRATNARKQRPDGTGVGLFLAKKVIDAHDGKVVFESKENKGSTFGFSLPLSKLRVRDTN